MAKMKNNAVGKKPRSKWFFIIGFLLALWIVSMIIAGSIGAYFGYGFDVTPRFGAGNIAVIPIKGEIVTEKGTSSFFQEETVSSQVVQFIGEADSDPGIKAIVFEIDSPGGSAVASEEIANAILQEKKPTVAVIRDIGTSGAYWVASATDRVYASRMSVTGSIGVISSYLEFSGTMEKYGVTYERLVAGEYKDIGSPFREMTPEEKKIFQSKIDTIHEYFLDAVAKNRNLSEDSIRTVADGGFFLGEEAQGLGLVDGIGNMGNAMKYLEESMNITARPVTYREKTGFFSSMSDVMSKPAYYVGEGIGDALKDTSLENSISIKT
jgi:protease-4